MMFKELGYDQFLNLKTENKNITINNADKRIQDNSIDLSKIKGGIISGMYSTAVKGARVVINGNDMYFYDDSTGGADPITGNSASLIFTRTDDETQAFVIRKRTGVNDDDENVMEMFFEKAANNSESNYIFLGSYGAGTGSDIHTDIIQLESNDAINLGSKNNNGIAAVQVASTDYLGINAGGTVVQISASQADTDNGLIDGGQIRFNIFANESTGSFILPMIIDKNGIWLVSTDFSQLGLLGVNPVNGALQWNGVDIS